jgi:polar amino acid transport system substrate-binding protein
MKQIVQDYSSGTLRVEEVPAPLCRSGGVVVRASYSLVSAGTERMKVDQARMSMIAKAKARPDKVKQVIQSVKQVGVLETYNKVRERLESLTPLGYSLAGIVEEVGGGLDQFRVGDRVACAGEGIACHAEFVSVPANLCTRVPDGVDLKDAAFTTVGAIAMNGVRQAQVTLGDSVVVIGLGLVGLLGVQILKAAGCQVIGVDIDPGKLELARACGADAVVQRNDPAMMDTVMGITCGRGADAAYIAASTKSSDPMELSGDLLRDRGTVVIVGMVPVEADWQTYYNKELNVVMSRSYGPGRYDHNYENKGIDYPVGYVRWTEGRNFESFLGLIASGRVNPGLLNPEVFDVSDAETAYKELHDSPGQHATGILFQYSDNATLQRRVDISAARVGSGSDVVRIGMIGAGNFATGTLIPALKQSTGASLHAICSARGLSARSVAERHGFSYCASDYEELLNDDAIDAVVIATRHDTHARFAAAATRAGKHVFVEKPLALNSQQLAEVQAAQAETGRIVMPGYNRRFSLLSTRLRDAFKDRSSPIEVLCRVNAGSLSSGSWYNDADEGGWRIISEGCHFVDLIQFISGARPVEVSAHMIGGAVQGQQNDNCLVTIRMEDGSLGGLSYIANGDPHFEKERIEVFGQGRSAVIENWRGARLYTNGKVEKISPAKTGKGHRAEMAEFIDAIREGREPTLTFEQSVACTRCTFSIVEALSTGQPQRCDWS